MLSRTAASLYWLGRYVERAEFTARLVEATLRLDALSTRPSGAVAWESALTVLDLGETYARTGQELAQRQVTQFLTIDTNHPGSVASCLDRARDNARAVRTSLSREAWSSINRAWLLFNGRSLPEDVQETIDLVQQAEMETRGFEGAIGRMLRNPSSLFMRIGGAIERADNTARLLDVKYHLLLPEGEMVGGLVDRDQWQTILQTVSAVNAYRWLYSQGLNPGNVIELLVLRRELPRSLAACLEEIVNNLAEIGRATGLQGVADRLARNRRSELANTHIGEIVAGGVHEYCEDFLEGNAALHAAISEQFRFH
jgi:uncharacterized alpha-E superfamily protein